MQNGTNQTIRTFRYRLVPTRVQEALLRDHLRLTRELYNAALEQRRFAYRKRGVPVTRGMQEKELPGVVEARPEFASIYSHVLQDVVKRLDRAFQGFFRRVRAGQTPGFPRFKDADFWDSFTYKECTTTCAKSASGWKWTSAGRVAPCGTRINVPKIGAIKARFHRPLQGRPKTLTIKREGTEWYAIYTCEVSVTPLPATGKAVGIDLGTRYLFTESTGRHEVNPGHLSRAQRKITLHSQTLARRKKGSRRRCKTRALLAKAHRKVSRQRLDQAHKTSRQRLDQAHKTSNALIRGNDIIVHEDLKPSKMVQGPASLSRAIHDAGWSQLLGILSLKAASAGRSVIRVDPAYTSQRCYSCGHTERENRTAEAFSCVACGYWDHADVNAARNILLKGVSPGFYWQGSTARCVPSEESSSPEKPRR